MDWFSLTYVLCLMASVLGENSLEEGETGQWWGGIQRREKQKCPLDWGNTLVALVVVVADW